MLKAIFPGSFDPPTLGHINIIERASYLFDEIVVVIAENRNKDYLFTADERIAMITNLVASWKNVSVAACNILIVEYMKKINSRILIRGLRGANDFAYEFELSMMNKSLNPEIETVFITTDPRYIIIRSSSIKEVASFHGDVSGMVPALVADALKIKFP